MDEYPVRERIVEQARERFFANGFSKVTMDELVQDLGISKKTLYQYFPSKDDLVNAVIEWQIIRFSTEIHRIVDSPGDFIDKIYTLYSTIGRMICKISKQFQDDIRRLRPDLWKKIEEVRSKHIYGGFSGMLDEGSRLGFVRNDLNREIVLLMYTTAIQGIVNPEVLARSSFSGEEAFLTILRVFFDGILTDPARELFHKKIVVHS
jgi:AcrR family transcriptional regulator